MNWGFNRQSKLNFILVETVTYISDIMYILHFFIVSSEQLVAMIQLTAGGTFKFNIVLQLSLSMEEYKQW